MESEILSKKAITGAKSFLNQLPGISYGSNAIPHCNIEGYGSGQIGFNELQVDFDKLDLSKALESSNLDEKLTSQQLELDNLEKKHASLTAIFGENGVGNEGSLSHSLLLVLQAEIEELIKKRDELLLDLSTKETDAKLKIAEINQRINTAQEQENIKVQSAVTDANNKVKIIKQFSDFLEETNKNMWIYFWAILGILLVVIIAIYFSIPNLLKIFDSYDSFIKLQGVKVTSWQIINYAFGLLIVKLPWALCISAILTGAYSLLKGLLITYEKINQDKRNMSAIYSVSGNVAESLNEYGIALADHDIEDEDTGEMLTVIRVSRKALEKKRENLKWNQIMNYFERMQQHKVETVPTDDPSKLKLVSDLLNKVIDKLPKT